MIFKWGSIKIICIYPLFDRTLLKNTMIDDGRD
jgi:hypothetical protein